MRITEVFRARLFCMVHQRSFQPPPPAALPLTPPPGPTTATPPAAVPGGRSSGRRRSEAAVETQGQVGDFVAATVHGPHVLHAHEHHVGQAHVGAQADGQAGVVLAGGAAAGGAATCQPDDAALAPFPVRDFVARPFEAAFGFLQGWNSLPLLDNATYAPLAPVMPRPKVIIRARLLFD